MLALLNVLCETLQIAQIHYKKTRFKIILKMLISSISKI